MKYIWQDYSPETSGFVEDWLDEEAVKFTGIDDGFASFYDYWKNEPDFLLGENYWCKVVFFEGKPIAVIAFCSWDGEMSVMEFVVAPKCRGMRHGSEIISELLSCVKEICGEEISVACAVVFPNNAASIGAFERAGFVISKKAADGSALYYRFERK